MNAAAPPDPGANPSSPLAGWWLPVLAIVTTIALGVSIYLAHAGLTGSSVAGCDGGVVDCSHVLTSRWSKVAGIPVAVPAVGLWAVVAACVVVLIRRRRNATAPPLTSGSRWTAAAVLTLTTCAAGSAIWFTGLQIFDLGHLCPYCLVAHTCGLVAAAVAWRGMAGLQLPLPRLGVAAFSSLATAGLIGAQWLSEPPATYEIITHDVAETSSGVAAPRSPSAIDSPLPDSPVVEAPTLEAPTLAAPTLEAPTLEAPGRAVPDSAAIANDQEASQAPSADDGSRVTPVGNVLSSPLREPTREQISAPDVFESPLSHRRAATGQWLSLFSLMPVGPVALLADAAAEPAAVPVKRLVPVVGGKHKLNAADWPLHGSTDDEFILAEMFDYTCSHCQATHRAIQQAKDQLGGRLAVLALPVPLHNSCNPYARNSTSSGQVACELAKLAIAVWLTDRSQFAPMHDYLMQQTRGSLEARNYANSLVDPDKLTGHLASSLPSAFIKQNVYLYNQAGEGALPKVMLPTSTLVGEVGSGRTIADLVQRQP